MPPVPPPTSITWIALAAIIVGAFVRTLKADALPALLTRLFRPEGPPITIPTRVLPWLALVGGGGLAFLEAVREGATYGDASKAAIFAAAGSVLGHELLSGVPGVKNTLGALLLIGGLAGSVSGCAFLKGAADATKKALTIADIVCLETGKGALITDAKEAATICQIADAGPELIEVIERLIGQREAAKRSGVGWGRSLDAGTPDGGR